MPRNSDDILEDIRKAKFNLEEEKGGYYHLIDLYRKLRQQLRKENNRDAAADVEEKLVYYLVEYGSYMKMMHEKKDKEAIDSLKQALHFDTRLPLAHYRLGFLYYRQKRFTEAGYYFSEALRFQQEATRFRLDDRQLYYAHLYLINSELHVVHDTHERMEKLDMKEKYEPLESADVSVLYDKMIHIDEYLENRAFIKRTKEEKVFLSKEKAEDLMWEMRPGELYLYFGDRNIEISHNGQSRNLSKDNGEILLYLLLYSRDQPLNGRVLAELRGELEEVRATTLRQRVSRLNRLLEEIGLEERIVPENGTYTMKEVPPYAIVHRSDERMEAMEILM